MIFKSNVTQKAQEYLKEREQDAKAAVRKAMTKTLLVGEARVKGIFEKEAFDTGRALRSVHSRIAETPAEIRGFLGSDLGYVEDIEKGRKPGKWPNLDAITKWCGRKLRQKGVNTRVNVTFDQLKELARSGHKPATEQQKAYRQHLAMIYLVGRKIATKGIREKLIFKRLEAALLTYARNEIEKELQLL